MVGTMKKNWHKVYNIIDTVYQNVVGTQESLQGYGLTLSVNVEDDDNTVYIQKAKCISEAYNAMYNLVVKLSEENALLKQTNEKLLAGYNNISKKSRSGRKSKFTKEQAQKVIKEHATGKYSIRELACKYECSTGTIENIVHKHYCAL